jgi:DnaD/phage-associated family protein
MSNQKEITELIKKISGQANILTIPRLYIDILGDDINAALILSQLVYWSDRGGRNDGWIYKSFVDWKTETSLSQYQVTRACDKLKKAGMLETDIKLANGAPTTHYRVNLEMLTNWIIKFLNNGLSRNLIMDYEETSQSDYEETSQSDYEETSQSLTETTQRLPKNSTETTAVNAAAVGKIYKHFENEIGVISKSITREIDTAIELYDPEWIIDAIKEAALHNVRKWSYVTAILKSWNRSGRNGDKDRQESEENYKRYLEGEFAEFIQR